MTSSPSTAWWPIAASVAANALLSDDSEECQRRVLRGLMTLYGLRGAMIARRKKVGSPLKLVVFVGSPDHFAAKTGKASGWVKAAIDLEEQSAPSECGLFSVSELAEDASQWVLCVGGIAQPMMKRADADAHEALRLVIQIDAAHRRRVSENDDRKRLSSLIDATEAGTWEWHVPSGHTRMNRRWALMCGRELEELEPLTIDTWVAVIHPQDLPDVVQRLQAHLAGRDDRYEAVYRMQHKDGSWIWVQDRGKVIRFTSDGRPELMAGSHIDISAIKRSEAMLESAHASLKTRNALLAASGRLALVGGWTYQSSDAALAWSEIVCAIHDAEASHRPSLEEALSYYTENSRPKIDAAVERCLASGTPWDLELEIVTEKGRTRWVRSLGEPEQVDGRVARILGAMQDITERRAMQDALHASNVDLEEKIAQRTKELQFAKQLAEDASRAKDEFLTNISHELRSPLHSILGFTGLVLDDKEPVDHATQQRFIGKSRSSASDLLKLVNDLLDAAKIESGRLEIHPALCDIPVLLDNVVSEFEVAIGNKGLVVERSYREHLQTCADPERFAQAVRNVLANAIRFSPQGGRIGISLSPLRPHTLQLLIEDEGPGIPANELDLVFDRFTQSSRTKTGAGGTGLGLPIARGILELHGGTLRAERRNTGGTTFVFEMPSE